MACSLEARLPILDYRMVELALQDLPSRFKISGLQLKKIFKKAVSGLIPESVLKKPKHGFAVPTDPWFRGNLKEYTFEILLDDRTIKRGYFQKPFIETMWREHAEGRHVWDSHLWLLLNFRALAPDLSGRGGRFDHRVQNSRRWQLCGISGELQGGFHATACRQRAFGDCLCPPTLRLRLEQPFPGSGLNTGTSICSETGVNPFKDLVLIRELRKVFVQEKAEICVLYTIKPVIFGSLAAYLASVEKRFSIITGLGYIFTDERQRGRLLYKIICTLYRLALRVNTKVFFQKPR